MPQFISPLPEQSSATQHPIEVLRREHQVVLAVLDDMERAAVRLAESGVLDEAYWQRVVRFHRDCHETSHHDKEELALFPALEALGLDPHAGPTAMLRSEHLRGTLWLQRIEHTLAAGDCTRLCAAIAGYVDFQRQHIRTEDQILFPLAMQLLPVDAAARLAASFRATGELDAAAARSVTSPGGGAPAGAAGPAAPA